MSTEQILLVAVAAVVVIGLVWYFRGRNAARDPDAVEFERERHQAAAASEEVRTEAMVRRVCPHCNAEVEASATTCPTCGYRFT